MTTSQLISLDTVRPNGADLVHLTGPLQVVARTATDGADGITLQVDLRCDAARVRGAGLKTGARYWAQGVHQSRHLSVEFSSPFDALARFGLLGCATDGTPSICLTLAVHFRVTIATEGRVTVEAAEVELLPDSGGCASPLERRSE
jgi:hypothetical protein